MRLPFVLDSIALSLSPSPSLSLSVVANSFQSTEEFMIIFKHAIIFKTNVCPHSSVYVYSDGSCCVPHYALSMWMSSSYVFVHKHTTNAVLLSMSAFLGRFLLSICRILLLLIRLNRAGISFAHKWLIILINVTISTKPPANENENEIGSLENFWSRFVFAFYRWNWVIFVNDIILMCFAKYY